MTSYHRLFIAAWIAVIWVSGAAQKEMRTERVFVDFAGPPNSISAMTAESAAVVVAKFTGETRVVEVRRAMPDDIRLDTIWVLEVVQVLKNHGQISSPGGYVEVSLPGGEKDMGDYIRKVVTQPYRPLRRSHQYVVFLKWNQWSNSFVLPWGPWSIYDLTGPKVMPILPAANVKAHVNKTPAEFVTAARARGSR